MRNPFSKESRERFHEIRPRRYSGYKSVSELEDARVDWSTAMSQAVVALDHAAHFAKKNKSTAGMREVAIGWLAVAESLHPGESGEDEDEEYHDVGDSDDNNEEYPIGFRGYVEPESDDDNEYDEEEEEVNDRQSAGFVHLPLGPK